MKKIFYGVIFFLLACGICSAADVTLQWDTVTAADLAGYRIYTGTTSGGPYELAADIPLADLSDPANPEYTLTGVSSGPIWIVATAYDTLNLESGYSNEVVFEGGAPAAPTLRLKITVEVTVE